MNQEPKTLSSLDEFQQERVAHWILDGCTLEKLRLWLFQEFDIQADHSVLAEHRDLVLNQLIQLVAIPNLPIAKTSQATQNSPAIVSLPNNPQSEILNLQSEISDLGSPRSMLLAFFLSHLGKNNGKMLSDILKIVGQIRSQLMTQRRQDLAVFNAEAENAKHKRDKEQREDCNRPFTTDEARAIIAKVENIS